MLRGMIGKHPLPKPNLTKPPFQTTSNIPRHNPQRVPSIPRRCRIMFLRRNNDNLPRRHQFLRIHLRSQAADDVKQKLLVRFGEMLAKQCCEDFGAGLVEDVGGIFQRDGHFAEITDHSHGERGDDIPIMDDARDQSSREFGEGDGGSGGGTVGVGMDRTTGW